MIRIVVFCLGLVLIAPDSQAQFIDCGPGGADCTDTFYGMGNDPEAGPLTHSIGINRIGPQDGSCGPEAVFKRRGRIRIREQNGCAVSATTRCQVEIPRIAVDSGQIEGVVTTLDLGPLGFLAAGVSGFLDFGSNVGHRQLSGSCSQDAGETCAMDSDCPSGAGCLSSCFSDPGTSCASQADCPTSDCRTEIDWDGIGVCTDRDTVCSSDADCPGEDVCLAGFQSEGSPDSCSCCQSSGGTVCPIFGRAEYPVVACEAATPLEFRIDSPDWEFDGGAGTHFAMETIQVPGQQEGVCNANRARACGALGDFWAGSANGKCTSGTAACAGDPFGDDLALASGCDDVDFGGTAGDFCDLSENSIRSTGLGLNPDGTPDITRCVEASLHIDGTPNELCALPIDIPEGDPQPGCRLLNFGIAAQPDLDCDGVDDTDQGRCMPDAGVTCSDLAECPSCTDDGDCVSGNCVNGGDLCPFIGEVNWFLDTNNDDIGDECQCGDANGDGAITGIDIGAVAVCANDPLSNPICDATIIDATGDNATTAEDIGGIVAAVNGVIQTSDLECLRNTDTTVP